MPEPFVGEIRPMAYKNIPRGWAPCEGQTMKIADNQALFALLGVTYGGDGQTTFCLPDLRGRAPMHPGPGFPPGVPVGQEAHQLTVAEMPAHAHVPVAGNSPADTNDLPGSVLAAGSSRFGPPEELVALRDTAVATAGADKPHENRQPYLPISFCIALVGVYPPRPVTED